MIWKTETHQFTATVCQKTGTTCPALAQTARAVVQALEAAAPATTADFEFDGSSDLTHCQQGCIARFRAQKNQVRVFCGSNADDPIDALNSYAEMLFGPEFTVRTADLLSTAPCAMLDVSSLSPAEPQSTMEQAAL